MTYRELPPPPALAAHVACLWWHAGTPARVVPDGCADLVWTGADLIVAGPATRAVVPRVPPADVKLGIRFRVGAAGAALGLPASELLDSSPALGEVWSAGDELAERVVQAPGPAARLAVLVEAIAAQLTRTPAPDSLVRAAVLDLARPRTAIARVGDRLGISERQLRRRFDAAVGYSPRTLARVLRFQRFLALAGHEHDLARLAADAEYADQPHMTRDCTALAGLSPAVLLAAGAGPAGESLFGALRTV
jgi:AraC-like DNA-binding protein